LQSEGEWAIAFRLTHSKMQKTVFKPENQACKALIFLGILLSVTFRPKTTDTPTCGRIGIEELVRDRNQLWAEAKVRFDSGAPWWLETAELVHMAADQQIERYEGDPWEDVIGPWLEARSSTSISEVLEKCLQKPQALWTQTDKNRAARCLRSIGWERYHERQGLRLEWRYRKEE
jgi:predicted P-loop ATPase